MENTQITTQENATTAVANLDITNFAELVERSTQLEKAKAILTLTAEYIELEKPGESFRGVYIGEQTMEIADKATGEIKALIAAIKEHDEHCRFKSIESEDLHDAMTFFRSFSAALEEGKSVVRKTIIVLLIGGIVELS